MKAIRILPFAILLASSVSITTVTFAQTVYIPSGTGGIGSSTNANVGIGTNAPVEQFEIVSGNRKIGFNGTIAGATPGGLLGISRLSDGAKTLLLGTTPTSSDNVIYGQGGNTELRLVSAGGGSAGFGFYTNTDMVTAFGATRPTPVMKLDGTGNLGIGTGTTAPPSRLTVVGTGNTTIDFRVNGRVMVGDANNAGGIFFNTTQTMFVGAVATSNLQLYNGGATRMMIAGDGNIGIGTGVTAPSSRLVVSGSGGTIADLRVNGRIQSGDANNNGGMYLNTTQTMFVGQSGNNIALYNGATRMQIDNNGNVGIGTGPVAANRVSIVGTGGTAADLKVNGRIQTGDGLSNGGVLVNSDGTMMFGANGATQLGLFYGGWRLVSTNSGNIGIGNTAPTNRLHVTGGGGTTVDFKVNGRMVTGDAGNTGGLFVDGAMSQFFGQYNATTMGLYNGGGWRMLVDATGNVGIGTAPDSKLTVKGIVHTQEVKVDLAGSVAPPDYVFDKDYKLPSLETVESYIDKNHHLPEVPSAKEMMENGVKVGEMNMLLLKKIEELTLYVIELKKENQEQAKAIEALKSKN